MKILLIAINAKYIHSNLAVYSLKASAGVWKDEVEIAEYTINHQRADILADIYRRKPDVAAFSCYIWNMEYVRALTEDLSKVLPETDIWLGGPEVSYDSEGILRELLNVRGLMLGEGESTFRELAAWYQERGESDCELNAEPARAEALRQIRGLAFLDKGTIFYTPVREYEDLDALPFVYEDLAQFKNRIIYYESSRGCPFSCSYCLSSIDKRVRFRGLEKVKKELMFFLEKQVPQVKFVDRTFNVNHQRTMEILQFIREHDNGITNFHFEVSADILKEEEIALLSTLRPGLVQLEIGVQSTDEAVLGAIHRSAPFAEIAKKVRKIKEGRNVHQHLDLIAGLPYGTLAEFRSSFNDVYSLRPEQFQLGFLKVLKGSEMGRRAEEFQIRYQKRPPYEVLSTKWISYEELLKIKGIEEMVEVYYNSAQFARTIEALVPEFTDAFGLYEALADFYEKNGYNGRSHSRMERLLILREFAMQINPGRQKELESCLLLDLYAREKSKSRPEFAPDLSIYKDEIYEFYKAEALEHPYLIGYEGMNARQLLNQTHMEILPEGWYLFDYRNRDPLTNDAAIFRVREGKR